VFLQVSPERGRVKIDQVHAQVLDDAPVFETAARLEALVMLMPMRAATLLVTLGPSSAAMVARYSTSRCECEPQSQVSQEARGVPLVPLPHHQPVGLLRVLRQYREVECPGDVHGVTAFAGDAARRFQVGAGGGCAERAVPR